MRWAAVWAAADARALLHTWHLRRNSRWGEPLHPCTPSPACASVWASPAARTRPQAHPNTTAPRSPRQAPPPHARAAMPPKLFLNVNASIRESLAAGAFGGPAGGGGPGDDEPTHALQAPSIEIGPSGTLKLFKSLQAFEFNPLGMTAAGRNITAPLASGAAAMQTSYKVCGRRGYPPGLRVSRGWWAAWRRIAQLQRHAA